jgi:DNA-binding protein H-NS
MVTLEQVQSRITKLQEKAEVLLRKKNASVIAEIKALLEKHGLTTADIDGYTGTAKSGAKRGPKPGAKRAGKVSLTKKTVLQGKGKLPAKYRDPKTGATWSGFARAPQWIANVKDRSKFLIDASNATVSAGLASETKRAGKSAGKAVAAGKLPAKYLNPTTGATWSGRGPAPAWLAAAKDRSAFLLPVANGAAADAGSVVRAKSTAKKSVAKKAVAKKVPAKKVAAKKAVVKKAVVKRAAVKRVAAQKPVAKPGVAKTVTAAVA